MAKRRDRKSSDNLQNPTNFSALEEEFFSTFEEDEGAEAEGETVQADDSEGPAMAKDPELSPDTQSKSEAAQPAPTNGASHDGEGKKAAPEAAVAKVEMVADDEGLDAYPPPEVLGPEDQVEAVESAPLNAPPPVLESFATEKLPDPVPAGAGRSISLSVTAADEVPDAGDVAFEISSVDEALEALEAEDVNLMEDDEIYDDDDDEIYDDEDETGDKLTVAAVARAAAAEDADDGLQAPPVLEGDGNAVPALAEEEASELPDDAALPAEAPVEVAALADDDSALPDDAQLPQAGLPWRDGPEDMAAELPDAEGMQFSVGASDGAGGEIQALNLNDFANQWNQRGNIWSLCQPLGNLPQVPAITAAQSLAFEASAEKLTQELRALSDGQKVEHLLYLGELAQISGDHKGARDQWLEGIALQEDHPGLRRTFADWVRMQGARGEAVSALEASAMVEVDGTASLLEGALYKLQEVGRIEEAVADLKEVQSALGPRSVGAYLLGHALESPVERREGIHIDAGDPKALRRQLHMDRALLSIGACDDRAAGIADLHAILDEDPGDLTALSLLWRLLKEEDEYRETADLALKRAKRSEGRQSSHWYQIAAEAHHILGENEAEIEALKAALLADGEDRVLEWRLEARLASEGDWAGLIAVMQGCKRYRAPEEMAVRQGRLAACHLRLGQDDDALEALNSAIAHNEAYGWARQRRLKLLQAKGEPAELIDDLCARASSAPSASRRAAYFFVAAMACEREAHDAQRALSLCLEAHKHDPRLTYLLSALRVALAEGSANALKTVFEAWPGGLQVLGLTGGGLVALIGHLISGDGPDAFLTTVEGGQGDLLAVAGALGLAKAGGDRIEDLVSTLEIVQSDLQGSAKAWLNFELAQISKYHLDNGEAAEAFLTAQLQDEADFLPAIWALRELGVEIEEPESADDAPTLRRELWPEADAAGDWQILLSDGLSTDEDDALAFIARGFALVANNAKADLARHLEGANSPWAAWHRGRLLVGEGDFAQGYQTLAAAEVQEPDETLAMELLWYPEAGLQALAVQAQTQPRLWLPLARFALAAGHPMAEDYAQRAADNSDDGFLALGLRAILSIESGLLRTAAERCRALADACDEQHYRGAHYWLASRLFAAGEASALALQCNELAMASPSAEALAQDDRRLLLRGDPQAYVGFLKSLSGGTLSKADNIHAALWLEAGDHPDAAIELLEGVVAECETATVAWSALTRLFEAKRDWAGVARCLESFAAITESEALQERLTEEWEEIRAERLEDPAARESRLRRLWAMEPPISASFEKLLSLLDEQERHEDALAAMDEELGRINDDVEMRANLRTRYAHKRLAGGDLEGAWQAFMDVLDDRSNDIGAINELESIAEKRQDWNGLVAVLARRAVSVPDADRAEIYRHIARVWDEKLQETRTAAASWEKVLTVLPDDQEALEALVRLYRSDEKWERFAQVVDGLLAIGFQDGALQQELGSVLASRLDRVGDSAPHLRAAALNGFVSESDLLAVCQHHEGQEEWRDAAETYRLIATKGSDEGAIFSAWMRLEELARTRLSDEELALEAQESLYGLRPEDPLAIHRLAMGYDLVGRGAEALEIMDLLSGNHGAFVKALPEDDKHRYYSRYAAYLNQESRLEEALAAFESVLALDPEDAALENRILHLLQEVGEWARCADHIEGMLERRGLELSTAEQVKLCLELGRSARRANQPERGIRAYERVTGMAPNEVAAYLGLIVIRKQQEEWNKLLGLYNQVIRYSTDPAQVVQAYVDKADILDIRLGASDRGYVEKAAMHFEKALQFDRRNTYCMMRLAEIALRERRFEKASRWLQSLFGSGPSMSFQARGHILNGILAAEFQKDAGTAKSHFKRAAAVANIPQSTVIDLSAAAQLAPGNLEALLELYAQTVKVLAPVAG